MIDGDIDIAHRAAFCFRAGRALFAAASAVVLVAGCNAIEPIAGDAGAFDARPADAAPPPTLSSLVLSAPVDLAPAFDPQTTAYAVSASVLIQQTTVTATASNSSATITVNGTEVGQGTTSPPIPLALGETAIEIGVANGDVVRTYTVTIGRGAEVIGQLAPVQASNPQEFDSFGYNIALSGDTLAVGAIFEDSSATGIDGSQDDESAPDSGAVYVFRRTGTSWAQEAYIKASNADAGDLFGLSVALSGDTLAVGATAEASAATGVDGDQTDNSQAVSGAVYVFRRTGTTWAQEAYIKASNTDPGDKFGGSVAVDGDTLVVGAPNEQSAVSGVNGDQTDNSADQAGAAYVFRRTGSTWAQEAYLKASNPDRFDAFGVSVAVDGDTVAVGALYEDSVATGIDGNQQDNTLADSGAAYVFQRTGVTWAQQAYVKASNSGETDRFSFRLAISGDLLAVTAYGEDSGNGKPDDNTVRDSGAVYLFRRTGTTWAQEAYLKASNPGQSDIFGISVALSDDLVAIAAPFEDSAAAGVDGDQTDESALDSGAVYLFKQSDGRWAQEFYIKASDPVPSAGFGRSIALSGNALAISAFTENLAVHRAAADVGDSAAINGAVYLFH
ncbi:MAG TPA: cadherin-like beta sandwich domain-containing protein [Kofleriaceae bacterium]|nr:cadherin-like beta sandwich domain-containing protein [Kofleriaceae bacterium]